MRLLLLLLVLATMGCDAVAIGCNKEGAIGQTLLTSPGDTLFKAIAPDTFITRFQTSRGDFFVQSVRVWAPLGADRFYNLVRAGFYDGNRFFRVVDGFVAQWGINGDPEVSRAWARACIPDDPVRRPNMRRAVTFAFGKPGTRTTQLFVSYGVNTSLDPKGFAPIGEVIAGMEVIDSLYASYGERPPAGAGPDPMRVVKEGNTYLNQEFPLLDSIIRARVVAERR